MKPSGTAIRFLVVLTISMVLGALLWGWVIILVWPLLASNTVGFGRVVLWLSLVVALLVGALSDS